MHCPICKKESGAKFKPFCSKRCSDLDLHGWFSGNYAIPSDDELDEGEVEQLIAVLESQ